MSSRLRIEGDWPGRLTIRKGFARADSRPWNDTTPMAHLRLVRGGGPGFLGECVGALLDVGCEGVLSPPLPRSAQKTWRDASFEPHASLFLMRRRLTRIPPPGHIVVSGSEDDMDEILRIDAAAFDEFWRFDRGALEEAIAATPRSVIQLVRAGEGVVAGFAVTGLGSTIAYLQRVAVDPRFQRSGIGRSLVRSAGRWAQKEGASTIMLNTQAGNEPAARLYESEGYDTLTEPLEVLRR